MRQRRGLQLDRSPRLVGCGDLDQVVAVFGGQLEGVVLLGRDAGEAPANAEVGHQGGGHLPVVDRFGHEETVAAIRPRPKATSSAWASTSSCHVVSGCWGDGAHTWSKGSPTPVS